MHCNKQKVRVQYNTRKPQSMQTSINDLSPSQWERGKVYPASQQCLAEFLLTYQVTPLSTTNESPSKLLMGRELRIHLDLLHPDCGSTVLEHQSQQNDQHGRHSRERDFYLGQSVMVRNLWEGPRWVQAVIVNLYHIWCKPWMERCGSIV